MVFFPFKFAFLGVPIFGFVLDSASLFVQHLYLILLWTPALCHPSISTIPSSAIPAPPLLPSSAIPTSPLFPVSQPARCWCSGGYGMPRDPKGAPVEWLLPAHRPKIPECSQCPAGFACRSFQAGFAGFFTALISPSPRVSLLRGSPDCCQPAHTRGNVIHSSPSSE